MVSGKNVTTASGRYILKHRAMMKIFVAKGSPQLPKVGQNYLFDRRNASPEAEWRKIPL